VIWPEAVKKAVDSRAHGRCEYCLLHETDAGFSHEIDHVISRKHGGSSDPENLAYACYLCNRYKGSDIGSIDLTAGEFVRLFNPRRDVWSQHFRISGPVLEPLTSVGAATLRLLRLNNPARVIERQGLQALERYPKS